MTADTTPALRDVQGGAALDELVAGARSLVPVLRERRAATELARRVPDETVADLRALGVLRTAVPRELGGLDLGADGIVEVVMELARGCPATAWCAGNWAVHNLLLGKFSRQVREEVFADGPDVVVSTGFSPARGRTEPVDGGAVLTGQWDFVSGIDAAQWVVVAAAGPAGPVAHVLPAADVEIVDTWRTLGLRGTGSHDVRADGVFVPAHRMLDMAQVRGASPAADRTAGTAFLRLPLESWFPCGVIATVVGAGLGAVDVFVAETSQRVGGLSGVRGSARPELHLRLGEAAAEIDAAALVVRRAFAGMREGATGDGELPAAVSTTWRRDVGWAAKSAAAGVARLFEAGGARSLYDGDQLQMFARDVSAGSHHYGISWDALFRTWAETAVEARAGVAR